MQEDSKGQGSGYPCEMQTNCKEGFKGAEVQLMKTNATPYYPHPYFADLN